MEKALFRQLQIPTSLNEDTRSFEAVISSDVPVITFDLQTGEKVDEILIPSGVELFSGESVPLMDSHDYQGTDRILGSCTNVRAEGNNLVANVSLSSIHEDEFVKIKEGHINKLSVGYRINEYVIILPGETGTVNGVIYTAGDRSTKVCTKWTLLEVSLVAIPADTNTTIRSADGTNTGIINNGNNDNMSVNDGRSADETTLTQEVTMDENKIRQLEKTRQAEIRTAGRALNISEDFISGLIDNDISADEARKLMIDESLRSAKPVTVSVETDESDNLREAATLSICQRAGVQLTKGETESVNKSNYRGLGIQGLARTILENKGERTSMMSNEQVTSKVLGRAMNETSDFTNILANVYNKVAQNALALAPFSFRAWTGSGSLSDFKAADLIQLSAFSALSEITEASAFSSGTFVDGSETAQLKTFGKEWTISRQAIINDDTNILTRVPSAMAMSAYATINSAVYATLEANAAMSDTYLLFSSNHANISAAYAAPSVTTLASGLQAIMLQASNSIKLGLIPRYLIVPASLAVAASQLVTSISDSASSNSSVTNPFGPSGQWRLEVVVDPNLADSCWYLACSPEQVGTISVYYLNGQQTPTVRQEASRVSAALGVSYDVFLDFGIAVEDYRGLYRNKAVA